MDDSRSHIVSTSAMCGTLCSTCLPSASSVAASSFSAGFLAPDTRTLPDSGGPGRTTKRSTSSVCSPALRRAVDVDALGDLSRGLVAVDAANPPGDEHAAGGMCREVLAPFGAEFEEFEVAPGRTSLLARVGDGGRPTLIVNGHLDVVPVDPAGWTHAPFAAERDGDRLYGRGTADMKGGIAAAVCALDTLRRAGREPACEIG